MLGKNQRSSRPQIGHVQQSQHSIQLATVARQRTWRTSVGFKLAVRGDYGTGGLVAPLSCTAYFGIYKLAKLFGCSLPQQALA